MTTTKTKSNELSISRFYAAPVSAVWDAWTDPEQVGKWWGPRGFTLTHHSKDLRVGGHWHYTMHDPDGTDYENTTKYFEVEKNKKLVYDHGGHKDRPPLFRVTVLFSAAKGGTNMEMTMAFATPEVATEMKGFIKKAGGNGTWDRLAEFLEKESSGKDMFVINRSFEAPIDILWDMWTKPENLSQWLPPTGLTMYGRADYLKMEKPHTLVYTQQFCDEKWPEAMLTTVRLTEESNNTARVTVTWEPNGKASPDEIATFIKERAGMTQGWTGSFDKLEEVLTSSGR